MLVLKKKKRIKIQLSSYTKSILNLYIKYLKKHLRRNNVKIGIVRLPTKVKRITLLKSAFVHKKAKSQYETKISRVSLFIRKIKKKLLNKLLINKPKSILIKITIV